VHGSLARVKDASPERERHFQPSRRVHVLLNAHADGVPLLGVKGHPLSPVRPPAGEETPTNVDGPTEVLVQTTPREERRLYEDQDAFHRLARGRPTGLLPTIARAGSSLTRPTLCPQDGDGVLKGRCKRHGAVTRWP
jgi:hypothetical protein